MTNNYTKPMLLEVGSLIELTNGAGKKKIEDTSYEYDEFGRISKIIYSYLS